MPKQGYYALKCEIMKTIPPYVVECDGIRYAEFHTEEKARKFISDSPWIGSNPRIIKRRNGGQVKIGRL